MMSNHVQRRDTIKNECVIICGVFEKNSAMMIFHQHTNLKYKFLGNYYVSIVGLNTEIHKKIRKVVSNGRQAKYKAIERPF